MKLENGRRFFYQWELNQRIEVPEGCVQVHFANGTSELARYEYVFTENSKSLVRVPDDMLRVAAQLRCYAWDGKSVIGYAAFDVIGRENPGLYIEPKEERRFDKLEAELQEKASIDDTKVGEDAWSAKNIVDKLCPAIEATGAAVRCEPVEGYPLNVVSHYSGDEAPGIIKLTRCGKNLYNNVDYGAISGANVGFTATRTEAGYSMTGVSSSGCGIMVPMGTLADLGGNVVTLSADIAGSGNMTIVVCAGDYNYPSRINIWPSFVPGNDSVQVSIPKASEYPEGYIVTLCFRGHGTPDPAAVITYSKIQVELGSEKTAYEPYKPAQTFTADLTNAPFDGGPNTYDWNTGLLFNAGQGQWHQHDLETGEFVEIGMTDEEFAKYQAKTVRSIIGNPGVNTFFSDCGDTTVKGRADIAAVIQYLCEKVGATSATMTALTGV